MWMPLVWFLIFGLAAQPSPPAFVPDLRILSQVQVGPPRTVLLNQRVQLGGETGLNPKVPINTYVWVQLAGPERVRFRASNSRFAWFDPPARGRYAFLLAFRDNTGQTQGYAFEMNVIALTDVRPDQAILTVVENGDGYVTPGSGVYSVRSTIPLTAYGRGDWVFDHWEGPDLYSMSNPLSLPLNRTTRIRVIFVRQQMGGPLAHQILFLTNEQRRLARIPPLIWSERLARAAANQARDMAGKGYLNHRSYNGDVLADRVKREKYAWVRIGENIAEGPTLPAVIGRWMQLTPDRVNILNPDFAQAGAAGAVSPTGHYYWVEVFAQPAP